MADKAPKFIDIKAPDTTTPNSTSRPIVVTNRSVLGSDPMVNSADDSGETKPAEPVTRSAKTIKPVTADLVAPESAAETAAHEEATNVAVETTERTAQIPEPAPEADAVSDASSEPTTDAEHAEKATESTDEPETKRDAAAETQADEAKAMAEAEAAAARQEQLEQLIASHKYSAPINAARRKRSRIFAAVLVLVAVVLAVAVFDALIDAGILGVNGIPHTDLLKDK